MKAALYSPRCENKSRQCKRERRSETGGRDSIKEKIKIYLFLTKHHSVDTYREVEIQFHAFLTSALHGDQWSALRFGHRYSKD
jgi:hypothetical protein